MNKEAMSTSRVAEADAMAVDEAGGVAPSREWMQAAQRALETDGIALCTGWERGGDG